MGQVILCHPYKAKTPYVIGYTGTRVYSYEELCFFVCENLDLIDSGIMDTRLVSWLKEQLEMKELADTLSAGMKNNVGYIGFISLLMRDGGYLNDGEMKDIVAQLSQIGSMSVDQKVKHQADKYLHNRKYAMALMLYEKLESRLNKANGVSENDSVLYGNILHNIGVVYSNMFLFELASDYFKKAYEYNHNEHSLSMSEEADKMINEDLSDYVNSGKEIIMNTSGADIDAGREFADIKRQAFGMCEHGTF